MSTIGAEWARTVVIVGATGDLAQRMLLPALLGLQHEGLLDAGVRIVGAARSELDGEGFRNQVAAALKEFAPKLAAHGEEVEHFLKRLDYVTIDASQPASLSALCRVLGDRTQQPLLTHLSTAPAFYGPLCEGLKQAGLAHSRSRLMLEKPIGKDLKSSQAINDAVARVFDEARTYRVDHYLGKEGVQNLLALRFGNALFEPLWNARHIDHVQISVAETVGVEGRWGYYDSSGALRDMVQNHLLQLLCLVAMEPPAAFDPLAVNFEKIKVLRSLRPIRGADTLQQTVSGQYSAGAIDGQAVPGYTGEAEGRASQTETFVAIRAHIDNWRWSGVPFYLRTGKRLPRRSTEIYIQFKPLPHSIFGASGAMVEPNKLVIELQPDERIEMKVMSKIPGLGREGVRLAEVGLDLDLHDAFAKQRKRIAYERLYLDAIEGNGTLFVHRGEVEAAWAWVDGIVEGWQNAGVKPKPYNAGTWGPNAAIALAERNGHSWRE